MEDNVIVSIHCIVFNQAPYLRQCLEGFIMQKTNFKFEAIVHDDASTDGSADIIREYAAKYPHIIKPIIEKENQYSKHDGNLNRIMEAHMRGKYIAFCEGDDYWIDPLKLQKQYDFMESHPEYSLCCTNGFVEWERLKHAPKYFNDIDNGQQILPEKIIGHWIAPTASLFIRQDVYKSRPKWNDIISGDQTLILTAMSLGNVYCLSDITCVYRKLYNGSILSNQVNKEKDKLKNNIILLYQRYSEFSNHKYDCFIYPYLAELQKKQSLVIKLKNMIKKKIKGIISKKVENQKYLSRIK